MNFEKPSKDILKYLFNEYKKGPAVLYQINTIARKHRVDAIQISDYLLTNLGYVSAGCTLMMSLLAE